MSFSRLDLAPDPPVRVVALAEPLERLAGAGQVVELAAADRLLDRDLDVRGALGRAAPAVRRRARVVLDGGLGLVLGSLGGVRGILGQPIDAITRCCEARVFGHGAPPHGEGASSLIRPV